MRTQRLPYRFAATTATLFCASGAMLLAQTADPFPANTPGTIANVWEEIHHAAVRLPLAAVLGSLLALRHRRLGTPERTMPVVETQIILAIVGALIMIVVGQSLARAFGIVGAANLIRYRAKIDNPKDAVVMLAALSVGLACGVGLYALACVGTLFVGFALWIIEGFEPEARKTFELTLHFKKGEAADLRPTLENVLRRFKTQFELRASGDDAVSYAIDAPANVRVDHVSSALERVAPGVAVEWDEKRGDKKK